LLKDKKMKSDIQTGFNDKKGIFEILRDYFNTDGNILKYFFGYSILLLLVTLLLYVPSLNAQGRILQDELYLQNPNITQPSFRSVIRIFSEVLVPSHFEGFYQPLTMISLMGDIFMGASGQDIGLILVTNLTLHTANVLLIYLLLVVLFKRVHFALFFSLIFTVHPLVVGEVLRVSGRNSLLGAFFGFLAILLYISYMKKKQVGFFLLALLSFALSVLSNPLFLMIPFGFVFLDRWPLGIVNKKNRYERFLVKLPFWILSLFMGLIGISSYYNTVETALYSNSQQFYGFFYNVFFYGYQYILPFQSTAFFPRPDILGLNRLEVWLGASISMAFLIFVVWAYRKAKEVFYGLCIFWVMFMPYIVFGNIHVRVAQLSNLYFSGLGLLFLGMYGVGKLWIKFFQKDASYKKHRTIVWASVGVFLVLGFAFANHREQRYWKDTLTVLHRGLALQGKDHALYFALAKEYERLGQDPMAVDYYKQALALGSKKGTREVGFLLAHLGKEEEAERFLYDALKALPQDSKEALEILSTLGQLERYESLIRYWQGRAQKESNELLAYVQLVDLYMKTKNEEKTLEAVEKALTIDPYQVELLKLGASFQKNRGNFEKARIYAEIGLRMRPDDLFFQDIVIEATNILDRMDRLQNQDMDTWWP
jgi:protein O-mannosyl-transferase